MTRSRFARGWLGTWLVVAVMAGTQLGAVAFDATPGAPEVSPAVPRATPSTHSPRPNASWIPGGGGGAPPGMIVPIQGGNPHGVDAVPGVSPVPSRTPGGGGGGTLIGPYFHVWPAPDGSGPGIGGPDNPQQPGAGPVHGEQTSPVGRQSSPTPSAR